MTRARRIRRWFVLWAAGLGFGLGGGLVARSARADVSLRLSPDGYVGAWLLASPFPKSGPSLDGMELEPRASESLRAPLSWLSWTVVDDRGEALDVSRLPGASKSRRVVLAGVLDATEPLDGWLLLSLDGTGELAVDGKSVWRRIEPHPRGPSFDVVPIETGCGPHVIAVDLRRHGRPWSFDLRVLDKATLEPPPGARFRLPGATDHDASTLLGHLSRVEWSTGLAADGLHPRVRVSFPRGVPDVSVNVSSTLVTKNARSLVDLGPLFADPSTSSSPAFDAGLPLSPGSPPFDKAGIQLGGRTHSFRLDPAVKCVDVTARATALHAKLESSDVTDGLALTDRDVTLSTLDESVDRLRALLDRADPTALTVAAHLGEFVDRIEAGKDPLSEPGVWSLARRSSLDGQAEPMSLHVPGSYRPGIDRRYPLVVVLHGLHGNPERVMAAFLGTASTKPDPKVDGFVVAPHAHGDAFYRGPGETEVLDVIDWVTRTYPIDRSRVSITGTSMGGTGAAHFALRYPDRFSAAGALAGYQSYFVRHDVLGRPIRAWEWAELSRWSPASWAENGRDLFLFVAQGTRDLPLVHSRSLADRYKSLGFPLVEKWPDIGHDVWRIVWGNAALWPTLTARRSIREPRHVTLKTDALRYATNHWAKIDALRDYAVPAKVDARVVSTDRIIVATSGVDALSLERPTSLLRGKRPVEVELDGEPLSFGLEDTFSVHRDSAHWVRGPLPQSPRPSKRAGVEGPIRDAFMGPLAFVYGTLDRRQSNAAREVAEHFRHRWAGDSRFPVIPDTALTDDVARTHSLFLVGSKTSNRAVQELDGDVPFGIDGKAVRAGSARLAGDDELGFACIVPNPRHRDRYVVLVEAVNVKGLFRSLALPMQLPDFIVFDSRLAPSAGQQILGLGQVLGAGYFDRDWALPAQFADAIAIPPRVAPGSWSPRVPAFSTRTPASVAKAPSP